MTGGCITGVGVMTGAVDAGGGAGWGAGERLAMSSGRTITAMNAAASPTIAEIETKVRNRSRGRVDMSRTFLIGKRALALIRMCIMRRLPGSRSGAFCVRPRRGDIRS
jgi:hypothetical protein